METLNYGFPKYAPYDAPNLCAQFNTAMDAIDATVKRVESDEGPDIDAHIQAARDRATTPIDVESLAGRLYTDTVTGLVFIKTM